MGLRKDVERLWPAVAALVAAGGLGVGLYVVGRGVNRPPIITAIEVEPRVVPPAGSARVRVAAEDPDGDALSFAFRAQYGQAEPAGPSPAREAQYRPRPEGPIADRLTVTVTDARGLASVAEQAITIVGGGPVPTPTPVAEVETPALPPPEVPPSTLPAPAVTLPPPAAASVAPRPSPRVFNRAPVLEGGTNFLDVEGGMVGLAATGHDPDGDAVTHKWEFGSCLVVASQTKETADVKLADGCDSANVTLTWTDIHGAAARTEWNLLR